MFVGKTFGQKKFRGKRIIGQNDLHKVGAKLKSFQKKWVKRILLKK